MGSAYGSSGTPDDGSGYFYDPFDGSSGAGSPSPGSYGGYGSGAAGGTPSGGYPGYGQPSGGSTIPQYGNSAQQGGYNPGGYGGRRLSSGRLRFPAGRRIQPGRLRHSAGRRIQSGRLRFFAGRLRRRRIQRSGRQLCPGPGASGTCVRRLSGPRFSGRARGKSSRAGGVLRRSCARRLQRQCDVRRADPHRKMEHVGYDLVHHRLVSDHRGRRDRICGLWHCRADPRHLEREERLEPAKGRPPVPEESRRHRALRGQHEQRRGLSSAEPLPGRVLRRHRGALRYGREPLRKGEPGSPGTGGAAGPRTLTRSCLPS